MGFFIQKKGEDRVYRKHCYRKWYNGEYEKKYILILLYILLYIIAVLLFTVVSLKFDCTDVLNILCV